MNVKTFLQKNWIHFAAIAFFFLITAIYFKPQLEGYSVKQHDVEQWLGASHESQEFRNHYNDEPLWTNSMFGGMPTTQITMNYPGNYLNRILGFYTQLFPGPIGIVLLHLIGFYILSLFLRIKPIIGIIGAIAFAFASYEIIIIQAGHITKAIAIGFMPPVLGAFIYAYQSRKLWGIILSSLFMAFELAANHIQVSYYFAYLLIIIGIYFLIDAIKTKKLKDFSITTAGLLVAYALAMFVNMGNILLTADYASHTIRGGNDITINPDGLPATNQSVGLDKDYITQWSYGIGETFTLISPNVKGGGSFAIGGSQFQSTLENSELAGSEINTLMNYPAYWGEQPFTSGPVYIGAISFLLALLGLIFLKNNIKWPLFAITLLAIALSWGKNFMGLTNFFIDHVPGYNKFRTVTIILVLVELAVPLLGVLFLDQLFKQREQIKEKKSILLYTVGAYLIFLILVRFAGLGDNYSSASDQQQIAGIENNIREQVMKSDPAMIKSQFQVDVNNPAQLQEFIAAQAKPYYDNFDKLKTVRKDIFNESMNRTILFSILGALIVLLFVYTTISSVALTAALIVLTIIDLVPVDFNYLGDQEEGSGYKYWEEAGIAKFPISSTAADNQILENELIKSSVLKNAISAGESEGKQQAESEDLTGQAKNNAIDAQKFFALNMKTNYRVFDLNGAFQSTRASYFHKSLGGYHGAKLRNINNLFDFHISKMNSKVFDMMNVKYFLRKDDKGNDMMLPNETAMGPAWLVRKIETYQTPNDEIRALGNKLTISNTGNGQFLVNGLPEKTATIYGGEKLQYVTDKGDSINVPLSNGLTEGMEALFVMDANGNTNLIPAITMKMDTAQSFRSLVSLEVINEFKPKEEAVMLASEAQKLSKKSFSGEGTVKFTSYSPKHLVYDADLKGKQFIVFSEIYYNDGWTAYIDGKETPIIKTNYLLRGLEVDGGKHKIEFKFDLPKYHTANKIAGVSSIIILLGLVIMGGYSAINKRKENQEA